MPHPVYSASAVVQLTDFGVGEHVNLTHQR